ncbi:phage major tail tube protein [Enterobacter bugandensis]|nr:phage major tail tube protein [Enterobacter bugandensis]
MPIYRGCSLLINGVEITDSVSYTPPEIRITKKAFKVGSMNAPVPIDVGTELMTAQYKCYGMDPLAFLQFGVIPGMRARLMVRRAYRGGTLVGVNVLEEMVEGFVESIRQEEVGSDERAAVGQVVTVAAQYYRITANNFPLLEINPKLGVRKIAGMDVLTLPGSFLSMIL